MWKEELAVALVFVFLGTFIGGKVIPEASHSKNKNRHKRNLEYSYSDYNAGSDTGGGGDQYTYDTNEYYQPVTILCYDCHYSVVTSDAGEHPTGEPQCAHITAENKRQVKTVECSDPCHKTFVSGKGLKTYTRGCSNNKDCQDVKEPHLNITCCGRNLCNDDDGAGARLAAYPILILASLLIGISQML